MTKVKTFCEFFPGYHPKADQNTHFAEKIHKGIELIYGVELLLSRGLVPHFNLHVFTDCLPKYHTIRPGNKFKAGEWVSLRMWGDDINPKSGRSGPYHSKQIIIAPDIQVKKVWNVEIWQDRNQVHIGIRIDDNTHTLLPLCEVALNDGFEDCDDFIAWFQLHKGPFIGQIICWSDFVNYTQDA